MAPELKSNRRDSDGWKLRRTGEEQRHQLSSFMKTITDAQSNNGIGITHLVRVIFRVAVKVPA